MFGGSDGVFTAINQIHQDKVNRELQEQINELLGQDTHEYMVKVSCKDLTKTHISWMKEELKVRGLLGHLNEVANDFDVTKSAGKAKAGCRFFEQVNERIKRYNANTKWQDERIELFSLPKRSFYMKAQSNTPSDKDKESKLEQQLKANIWL
ncbi:hypothetical protein F0249_19345 [Vibrio sp. 03-59-1]|uniref:hypothetical protein n=1 Tax=Vibrio sp. 03-59-1 TaxID=2607607 RepID=UPI0014935AC6|nr:hypothetical protein [Vibrio sp. 03-59-1]NOH85944.1 hypothetical protein [Vibrio sp. 03-59-1]